MGKPVNIASTAHSQAKEMAQVLGAEHVTPSYPDLRDEYQSAMAQVEALTAELAAEKEAHEKTQAALTAATTATGS